MRSRSADGYHCPPLSEQRKCNEKPCLVCDGVREWSRWSECSASCGGGKSLRTRVVDVTACSEVCQYETLSEVKSCNVNDCPCEGLSGPTEWGAWSECSSNATCEGQGLQTRSRSVVSTLGGSCYQENVLMVQACNSEECPCPFTPTQWTEWGSCSVTCGGGDQQRTREIVLGSMSSCWKETDYQTKPCNINECPVRDICSWWEFLGGTVSANPFPEDTWSCHADLSLLPAQAEKYAVGMGAEYVDQLSPIESLCGACILFTALDGKVRIFIAINAAKHKFVLLMNSPCLCPIFISQESTGIVTHIVPRGWQVSEAIFSEIGTVTFSINSNVTVSSVQVVECPLDLVQEDVGIKVVKNANGDLHGYQAINMRNPISRLSISGDEGATWTGLSQEEGSDAFLHPKDLDPALKVAIRVESWMGGSNVQVEMGSPPFQDEVTKAEGNNVCRGKITFL